MPPTLSGWLWNGEALVRDDSVVGCNVRGAQHSGRCYGGDCSRRVTVDLNAWSNMGYARMQIDEVRRYYECRRKPECGMTWTETYPKGLPLQLYVGDHTVQLVVRCEACKKGKIYDAQALIRRFVGHGIGDGNLGVNVAGKFIRGRCACGAREWIVDVKREDPMEANRRRNAAEGTADRVEAKPETTKAPPGRSRAGR